MFMHQGMSCKNSLMTERLAVLPSLLSVRLPSPKNRFKYYPSLELIHRPTVVSQTPAACLRTKTCLHRRLVVVYHGYTTWTQYRHGQGPRLDILQAPRKPVALVVSCNIISRRACTDVCMIINCGFEILVPRHRFFSGIT